MLSDAADRLGDRRLHPRRGRRRADVGAGHGHLLPRAEPRELSRWTEAMIASGERLDFSACPGRPPTSTPPAASVTRSPCRWPRWSPRAASPCRSCPAAAWVTPAARWTSWSRSPAGGPSAQQRRDARAAGGRRCGDLRGRLGARPGRQEAVRAARRHRHRRVHPADRLLDHEQEDRRGHRCAGAGREGRLGRVHEGLEPAPRSWPGPWSGWAPTPACGRWRC